VKARDPSSGSLPSLQARAWAQVRKPEAAAAGLLTTLVIAITMARALPVALSGLAKLSLMFWGAIAFFLSRDKSWRRPKDCEFQGSPVDEKTIVFVRHGESCWNEIFNKGKNPFKIIARLIKAIAWEVYLFFQPLDSCFYDSPLSTDGIDQAMRLLTFLESSDAAGADGALIKALRGDADADRVVIFSSPLRRAISTMLIGFSGRLLRQPHSRVIISSDLQEMTRNVDGICITPAGGKVVPSFMDQKCGVPLHVHNFSKVDHAMFKGNKGIGSKGLHRMQSFVNDVFNSAETKGVGTIIVGGHSLWFKSFFDVYLPKQQNHVSRKKKMKNCGAVAFTLQRYRTGSGYDYKIDVGSIKPLYLGFSQ
jgi:broad specificity phosphatase PhoE